MKLLLILLALAAVGSAATIPEQKKDGSDQEPETTTQEKPTDLWVRVERDAGEEEEHHGVRLWLRNVLNAIENAAEKQLHLAERGISRMQDLVPNNLMTTRLVRDIALQRGREFLQSIDRSAMRSNTKELAVILDRALDQVQEMANQAMDQAGDAAERAMDQIPVIVSRVREQIPLIVSQAREQIPDVVQNLIQEYL